MSKHKATAAEKRDMAATALFYVGVAGIVVCAYALLGFLLFAPFIWAIWDVATQPVPNPGAGAIIILWSVGILTVAIIVARAILLPPRTKPQTRAWPPKAVWPESEFQRSGNLGEWTEGEK